MRESLRQVERAQGEVRKPKCQRLELINQALIGLKPVNACVHTYTKPQTSSTRSRFCDFVTLCRGMRGNGVIHRGQKLIQGDDNGHVGRPG